MLNRILAFIIVLTAALVYLRWESVLDFLGKMAPESRKPSAVLATAAPTPVPIPTRRFAPPGVFYLLQRAPVSTGTGAGGFPPGKQVTLLSREQGGKLRVKADGIEFMVKNTDVTDDLEAIKQTRVKLTDR